MVFKKKIQQLEGVLCYYVGHFFLGLFNEQKKKKKKNLFKVKEKKNPSWDLTILLNQI